MPSPNRTRFPKAKNPRDAPVDLTIFAFWRAIDRARIEVARSRGLLLKAIGNNDMPEATKCLNRLKAAEKRIKKLEARKPKG